MGWVSYTQEKRRKAARISAALEERRRRKLREGVSRWLLYAADMTKFRQKLAASRQAEVTFYLIIFSFFKPYASGG